MSEPFHLFRNGTEDDAAAVWCGSNEPEPAVRWPTAATCEPCLKAALTYGDDCMLRLAELAMASGPLTCMDCDAVVDLDTPHTCAPAPLMHGAGSDWEKS